MWAFGRPPRLLATVVLTAALGLGACTVYQPVRQESGQTWADARAAAARAAERVDRRTHRVREGESVGRLAQHYEVPAREIIAANQLKKPYGLRTGQTLVIPPGRAATAAAQPAPAEPVARAPEATVAASPAARVEVAELPPAAAPAQPAATPRPALPEPDPATLRRAQETPPPPLSGEGFLQPVAGRVVSGFGDKPDGRRNDGINLAARRGTPVRAAENGIVVYAGESIPGFGVLLLIRHADGYTTAYGHLERATVAVGDRVERGQVVARVGDTGDVKTAQLHFQLRSGATPVDPRPHLVAAGVQLADRPDGAAPGG
jgi:murein DD-endopeptidase MepM/ murein hydrolase activator NlpD